MRHYFEAIFLGDLEQEKSPKIGIKIMPKYLGIPGLILLVAWV